MDRPHVSRVTRTPLLKGIRVRNAKVNRRINQTGRRRAVKAPPGERLERYCPHLTFFEPDYYDRVVRIADEANARYRRKGGSRKRTTWSGQHLRCGVCNRI